MTSFSQLLERDENIATVAEIVEQSGIPYLSGPFDYKAEHLNSLKLLRTMVLKHLFDEYGVNSDDKIELYYHTHYSISTTTMHLHIRINQIRHGLELDKSLTLDEIIDCLERGEDIKKIFLRRGVIHKELKSLPFLKATGYKVSEVDNPYYIKL